MKQQFTLTRHPRASATFLAKHQPPHKRTLITTQASPGRELLSALFQQAKADVVDDWLSDLVVPLFSDSHGSELGLPETVPPSNLADDDSKYIDAAGVHLHYKERRKKQKTSTNEPTVLLLHGFNGSVFNYRFALDAIHEATGLRVVAFDRPPFGLSHRPINDFGNPGSAVPFNPYTLDGSAKLTQAFLDALKIDNVIVVGHSAGALVAMELFQLIPDRIIAFGLIAPAVPSKPGGMISRTTLGGQLRLLATRALLLNDRTGVRFVRRQILKQRDAVISRKPGSVPHASQDGVDDELIEGYLKPLRAVDWDTGSLLNLRSLTMPSTYNIEGIKVPTLVIQGTHDRLVDNAKGLVERLRSRNSGTVTEFVELECGHVPQEEMPEEFNEAVVKFIQSYIQ